MDSKQSKSKKDKVDVVQEEFQGNVRVSVSEHEVRIWVCNEEGMNIFRFKALGKVYDQGKDIMVISS